MSNAPSHPLATQIGGIAADLRAHARDESARAGLEAVVRALILAALARIFARLETMIGLWEAGRLPIQAPRARRASAPRPAPPPAPVGSRTWLAALFPPAAPPRPSTPRTPAPRQAPARHAVTPSRQRAEAAARTSPTRTSPAGTSPAERRARQARAFGRSCAPDPTHRAPAAPTRRSGFLQNRSRPGCRRTT